MKPRIRSRSGYSVSKDQQMQYMKDNQNYLIPGSYSYCCFRIRRGDPSIKTEYFHFIEFKDDTLISLIDQNELKNYQWGPIWFSW
ncbi:hypothetical protein ACHQM5_020310 [Ranunculus cassubicifolius]